MGNCIGAERSRAVPWPADSNLICPATCNGSPPNREDITETNQSIQPNRRASYSETPITPNTPIDDRLKISPARPRSRGNRIRRAAAHARRIRSTGKLGFEARGREGWKEPGARTNLAGAGYEASDERHGWWGAAELGQQRPLRSFFSDSISRQRERDGDGRWRRNGGGALRFVWLPGPRSAVRSRTERALGSQSAAGCVGSTHLHSCTGGPSPSSIRGLGTTANCSLLIRKKNILFPGPCSRRDIWHLTG